LSLPIFSEQYKTTSGAMGMGCFGMTTCVLLGEKPTLSLFPFFFDPVGVDGEGQTFSSTVFGAPRQ
jgi:hypothetical protein